MKEKNTQLDYAYWLDNVKGVGHKSAIALLEVVGSPYDIYKSSLEQLEAIVSKRIARNIIESKVDWDIEKNYEQLYKMNVRFYPYWHDKFPKRLLQIPDIPYGIYVKGAIPEEEKKTVAIIGTRECSSYGEFVAREFSQTLAKEQVQIISGMARGIDSISQKAALDVGGKSYAVLGSGVEVCYPKSAYPLYRQLIEKGGILSTYLPKTEAKAQLFPPRNRIISGLADILLVVESSMKSGTLITVDMALEQGKEVYVVPGRITDKTSHGCNHLIKQGANIVLSPEELLLELGIAKRKQKKEEKIEEKLTKEEMLIYEILDIYPKSIGEINHQVHALELTKIMEILIGLCIKNKAKCVEGNCYLKV